MGKIDELIQQYCPEGVEYVSIGSLITRVRDKGKNNPSVKTVYSVSNTLGLVKAEDFRDNVIYSEDTSNYVVVEQGMFAYNPARLNIGSLAYLQNNQPGLVSPMYVVFDIDKSKILPEYLYLYLKSPYIIGKINSLTESGARFRFDFERWGLIEIPLPPLPVQEAIVKILDRFAVYAAELQAELQARQQQYNYYRDTLLTNFNPEQQVKECTLGELGTFTRGNGLQKKDFTETGVGCIHYGQIYTRFGAFTDKALTYVDEALASRLLKVETGNLVIACTSENVEDICKCVAWLGEDDICIGGHACVFRHKQNPKYIAYYFQTGYFFNQKVKYTYGTKVKDIKPDSLAKIKIPLPSLQEQERIVSILDKLYILSNDLSQGLPAEIEARRKQYEYYRDQLLTFKRK